MDPMFFESKSKFGFDETVTKLTEIILAGGWKVTHTHDLQETMKKNGLDVAPVKVIELCNPKHAYRILSDDEQRIYSNMLPCRLSIHEKADGNAYVSRMNTAMLAAQIGGVAEDVMKAAFSDAEKFISEVTE